MNCDDTSGVTPCEGCKPRPLCRGVPEAQPLPSETAQPMFASHVGRRKWESLQGDGYRMQRIHFARSVGGYERRGSIDPWGKVLWEPDGVKALEPAKIDWRCDTSGRGYRLLLNERALTGDEAVALARGVAPRKATNAEVAEWAERHDLRGSATDLRAAFEDAASLHLTCGAEGGA